jgi:hypothetical protein
MQRGSRRSGRSVSTQRPLRKINLSAGSAVAANTGTVQVRYRLYPHPHPSRVSSAGTAAFLSLQFSMTGESGVRSRPLACHRIDKRRVDVERGSAIARCLWFVVSKERISGTR